MPGSCRDLVDLYAVGALEAEEREEFERHFDVCETCRAELMRCRAVLTGIEVPVPPTPRTRERVLDFSLAPREPVPVESLEWEELAPGVRVHVFHDDMDRGVRASLMWVEPGAARPSHRHLADEEILVLEGGLVIGENAYSQGEICRIRGGWFHDERAAAEGRCLCYVIHRPIEGKAEFRGEPDARCVQCVFYAQHAAGFRLLGA
jgi:anti-sigma factor ChrR (cupin superfamily)